MSCAYLRLPEKRPKITPVLQATDTTKLMRCWNIYLVTCAFVAEEKGGNSGGGLK